MNIKKIAGIVLGTAASFHLLNFLFAGQMSIWGYVIPSVFSLFIFLFLGYLAYQLITKAK
tara:strand:+ start:4060 stop:4239 length:180 start_codon:yes stop_codon:yes gene_type:complete